jgi:hypothetical protein
MAQTIWRNIMVYTCWGTYDGIQTVGQTWWHRPVGQTWWYRLVREDNCIDWLGEHHGVDQLRKPRSPQRRNIGGDWENRAFRPIAGQWFCRLFILIKKIVSKVTADGNWLSVKTLDLQEMWKTCSLNLIFCQIQGYSSNLKLIVIQ